MTAKETLKRLIPILFALISSAAVTPAPEVQTIDKKALRATPDGFQGEVFLEKTIKISADVLLPLRIDVTAHGNGALTIANLSLFIYDDHDDGKYYENELLTTAFSDINGDGCLDLVIHGRILYTDDRGDTIIKKQDVAFLYLFDKPSAKFVCIYHTDGVSIDTAPEPTTQKATAEQLNSDEKRLVELLKKAQQPITLTDDDYKNMSVSPYRLELKPDARQK